MTHQTLFEKSRAGPAGPAFSLIRGPLKHEDERLKALIEPVVEAAGYELVRVRVTGGRTKTLQVMAERADHTMTAEDCARLSRALSPTLEEADPD